MFCMFLRPLERKGSKVTTTRLYFECHYTNWLLFISLFYLNNSSLWVFEQTIDFNIELSSSYLQISTNGLALEVVRKGDDVM